MAVEDKTVLSLEQVDEELENLEGWTRSGSVLSCRFAFANFRDITSFLSHLVRTITEQNHHPDFNLDTSARAISVSVTTHSAKALTRADIQFARALNAWQPGR